MEAFIVIDTSKLSRKVLHYGSRLDSDVPLHNMKRGRWVCELEIPLKLASRLRLRD